MKKIKIALDDLLVVLEALKENGTEQIIIYEHNGYPAISDYEEPGDVITFQSVSETGEVNEDDEVVH